MAADIGKLVGDAQGNPEAAAKFGVQLMIGEPLPELKPQKPGTGIVLTGRTADKPLRFVFKKAHASFEDYRIYDEQGNMVCVSHHVGKNPLSVAGGLIEAQATESVIGEWESKCEVSGYSMGMPAHLKIRPKKLSKHGIQLIMSEDKSKTFFCVGKMSRLKTGSLRHNLEVAAGDEGASSYKIMCDLAGRTMDVKNEADETVIFIEKPMKTLIKNAALGMGSELLMTVAPGVDYTAACAMLLAIQQVGKNLVKDVLGNFLLEPLMDTAVQGVLAGG